MSTPLSPAHALYFHVQGQLLFLAIPLVALLLFTWTVLRRLRPLLKAQCDPRWEHPVKRAGFVLRYWLGQWKHPRYRWAGLLHIVIFAGFLVLALRSLSLVVLGVAPAFQLSSVLGPFAHSYDLLKDYAATAVCLAVVAAAIRRAVFHPARYAPRPGDTRNHAAEAFTVLGLIAVLMLSESLFAAGAEATQPPLTLASGFRHLLAGMREASQNQVRLQAYLIHEVAFFTFLCFLPFGKHFHVLTSLFNVYFSKLSRGSVKPVRWGMGEGQLEQAPSFGVRQLSDFSWKHLLDFYSCADCGRCSDNCPAFAAGRPLSPRFLTLKARDRAFAESPVFGKPAPPAPLVGSIYSADEIWSCTTCGACEEECPMQVEYIDKIVDLRRALVDNGDVPASLQKPLRALESRGNPYGKLEKKRAEWVKTSPVNVKALDGRETAKLLFFVDSVSSFDERLSSVTRATASLLAATSEDFGFLGAREKDSGHEVRRFGEESLFQALRDHNSAAIRESGAEKIVTSDPHALNALRHDYRNLPPVEHISQLVLRHVDSGKLRLQPNGDVGTVVYHDPCYLGRHNLIYDEPRAVLDAIPGLKRVEMKRCRDRSFCCGGGGLMLFYEAPEKERIGVLRARMAAETGADTIVTACPFCLINLEDGIKVAGLEGRLRAMDLTEVLVRHLPDAAAAEHFGSTGHAVTAAAH